MNDDLISRQAVLDAVTKYCLKYDLRELLADIECLQTADLSEYSDKLWKTAYERGKAEARPKKGKWIKHSIGHEHTPWGFDCSKCGEWLVVGEEIVKKYNYCPNCGADMRGEEHD